MNKDNVNQVLNLINKSKKILLLTHARADADGLGAMISMYLILKEMGKDVVAVTNDPTPENLDFLPAMNIVQHSLASAKDFIITVDCSFTEVNKIKYSLDGNRVNIIISPKSGQFNNKDVSFAQGADEQYDLIITFDTGNLEHLGPIYDQNTEMFFKTPLINVDHHTSNTEFGQVNFVDVVASSSTQILYELLLEMEKQSRKKLITEDIATLLLAGLITDTGSFQHANTSPQAMEAAAQLLDRGGRQQEIIKNIYKTKKLSTLKLWGIVLSRVQVDPVYRMVWSTISQQDLKEAGAASDETGSIIDDLLTNAPGAEVIFIIKHCDNGVISVSMRSTSNQADVGALTAEMGGGGHVRAAGFKVKDGRTFEQVVSDVVTRVRTYQAERLNIHPEDLEKAREVVHPRKEKEAEVPPKTGKRKETYLDFGVSKPPTQSPAEKPKPKEVVKQNAEQPPAEEKPKKRKRNRKKKKPAAPVVPVFPSAPSVPPAPPAPPAPPETPAPVTEQEPKPVPEPVPAPIAAPAVPEPPKPEPPVVPPPPTPFVPPQPAARPQDNAPDVPDWLKAE